jgi:acetoin utilization deacetylase AcuC-like enzyme
MYVSLHGDVTFPGTGNAHERGPVGVTPTTVNLPVPAGATGDVYLALVDQIVAPVVERFAPDWVLVSCGFDAHADDPITSMALTAADFGHLTRRVMAMAPPGRTVVFFEGGYDLDAVEASSAAVLTALTGDDDALAPPSTGGPGAGRLGEFSRIWLSDE